MGKKIKETKPRSLTTINRIRPKQSTDYSSRTASFGDSFIFGDGSGSPKSLFRLYNSQEVLRKFDISIEGRPTLGERKGQKRYEPVLVYVQDEYVNINYVRARP